MKHMNMSVPRDCGIRYGALGLALLFASGFAQEDILDHCCFAWNKLINMPWKVMFIGSREWAYRS